MKQSRDLRNKLIHVWKIFAEGANAVRWRKNDRFNNVLKQLDSPMCYPYHVQNIQKFNPKWITQLNVKPKTIKFQRKAGENLCDLELVKDFLDVTPKTYSIKEKK